MIKLICYGPPPHGCLHDCGHQTNTFLREASKPDAALVAIAMLGGGLDSLPDVGQRLVDGAFKLLPAGHVVARIDKGHSDAVPATAGQRRPTAGASANGRSADWHQDVAGLTC